MPGLPMYQALVLDAVKGAGASGASRAVIQAHVLKKKHDAKQHFIKAAIAGLRDKSLIAAIPKHPNTFRVSNSAAAKASGVTKASSHKAASTPRRRRPRTARGGATLTEVTGIELFETSTSTSTLINVLRKAVKDGGRLASLTPNEHDVFMNWRREMNGRDVTERMRFQVGELFKSAMVHISGLPDDMFMHKDMLVGYMLDVLKYGSADIVSEAFETMASNISQLARQGVKANERTEWPVFSIRLMNTMVLLDMVPAAARKSAAAAMQPVKDSPALLQHADMLESILTPLAQSDSSGGALVGGLRPKSDIFKVAFAEEAIKRDDPFPRANLSPNVKELIDVMEAFIESKKTFRCIKSDRDYNIIVNWDEYARATNYPARLDVAIVAMIKEIFSRVFINGGVFLGDFFALKKLAPSAPPDDKEELMRHFALAFSKFICSDSSEPQKVTVMHMFADLAWDWTGRARGVSQSSYKYAISLFSDIVKFPCLSFHLRADAVERQMAFKSKLNNAS